MTVLGERRIVIATGWWGRGAAISEHFRALAEELAGRGHRVVLLVSGRPRGITNETANPAIHVWPSKVPTRIRDARFFWRLLGQYRPDGLIANFEALNWMMLLGRAWQVPIRVAWSHTLSPQIDLDFPHSSTRLSVLRWRRRMIYRCATDVVAVSQAGQADIQSTYGVSPKKCSVLHYSCRDPWPSVHGIPTADTDPRAVCVARLDASKGQDTIIRAAARLKADIPNLRIEFIGNGPARVQFEQLAVDLGVADMCSFSGGLDHDEVVRRIRRASVSLVPSQVDNTPFVVMESLGCGTPVVASRAGGIVELVRDGVDGILATPGDPSEFAAAIATVVSNPTCRAAFSHNARERFAQRWAPNIAVPLQADWLESRLASERNRAS